MLVVGSPRKINKRFRMFRKLLIDFPPTPPVAASPPSYRNVHAGRAPGSRQRHAEYAPRPGEAHGRHAPGGGAAARQRPRRHPCCYLDAGTLRIAATSKSKAWLAARPSTPVVAEWPRLPAPKRRRPGLPLWRFVVWSAGAPHSVAGRTSVSPPVIDIGSLLMRGVKTEESRALGTLGDLEGQRLAVRIGYNSWEGPVRGRCEQLPPHLTLTLTLSTLP